MAIIYQSSCNTSADFTSINGSGIVVGDTGTGYVGNSLKIDFSSSAYVQQSARITLSQTVQIFQVYIKIPTATTLSTINDAVVTAIFSDSGYSTPVLQLRVQGSGTGFQLKIVDPSNSYAGDYSLGTIFDKDRFYRLVIERTATQWKIYEGKSVTPILQYTPTIQPAGNFTYVSIGCENNNAASAIVGNVYFDQIMARNPVATTTTFDQQCQEVWESIQMRYITTDGAVIRPIDVNGGQMIHDLVSEGVAYGLLLAAQLNDQETFKRIDNWTRANLDRRNSTVGNSNSNPAPTTALNLMAFKYIPNAAKPIDDANWAGDAEPERAVALLWGHARWGSSQYTLDTPQELAAPNYYLRAKNIIDDLRNYAFGYSTVTDAYYLLNDSFQLSNTTVQLAPDYNYSGAYKIFALIDPTNAVFWSKCAKGAYDINDKACNYIYSPQTSSSGLLPNWCQFDLTTATVTGTSTYGNSDWGYNSFRTNSRLVEDWNWYRDIRAVISMQKPKAFLTQEWNANSKIVAEYKHDGTIQGNYETRLFYYIYYFILSINDPTNSAATAILSTKLNSGYTYSANGSYFGAYGYFDDFWQIRYEMQRRNVWTNWGQPQLNNY